MTGSTVEPLSDWQDVLGNEIVALQLALVRVVGDSASDVAVFRTQSRNRDCQRNLSSRLLRAVYIGGALEVACLNRIKFAR